MKRTYYTNTDDYQGSDFALGRTLTIEGWRKQALSWADNDCLEGVVKELKKLPKEEVIGYINEFWTIEIKPTEELTIEELKGLAEFTYDQTKPIPNERKKLIAYMNKYC